MRALFVAFAVLSVLGGCLEDTSTVSPAAVDRSNSSPTNPINQTVPASTGPAPSVARMAALHSTSLNYSGATAEGACAFAPIYGQCQFVDGGSEGFHALTLAGKPVRLSGTIQYSQKVPGGSFYAYVCREQTATNYSCLRPPAHGASPLAFSFDLGQYNATDKLFLGVDNEYDLGVANAGAVGFGPATFALNATLLTIANATGTMR